MLHVQDLVVLQLAVQVRSLDVYLVQLKIKTVSHCNDGSGGWQPGYRCVSVVIIDLVDLAEAFCHQPHFVSDDCARGVLLRSENPLGTNDVSSWWRLLKSPCAGHL